MRASSSAEARTGDQGTMGSVTAFDLRSLVPAGSIATAWKETGMAGALCGTTDG